MARRGVLSQLNERTRTAGRDVTPDSGEGVQCVAERLRAWVDDVQISARVGFPHYANPGELKDDIRGLLEQFEVMHEALEQVADCVHVVRPGFDGHPVIVVRQPGTALDAAVETAKAALVKVETSNLARGHP